MINKLFNIKLNNNVKSEAISLVVVLNLINVAVALLKDVFVAAYLGTTIYADAFFLAFFLTDMVGNTIFAFSVGIASIPLLSELSIKKEEQKLIACIKSILKYSFFYSIIMLMAFILFRYQIVENLGNGFTKQTASLSANLLIIILPNILIYPFLTLGASFLQIHNKFTVPAAAPILLNGIYLLAVLLLNTLNVNISEGIYILSLCVFLSVLIASLYIWIYVAKKIKTIKIEKEAVDIKNEMKQIFATFMTCFFILVFSQSILFYERFLASQIAVGSVAALSYAYRLSQFPVIVFTSAITAVIFPAISKAKGIQNHDEIKDTFIYALMLTLAISIPMALVLLVLRIPVISILFLHKAFEATSLAMTSDIFLGYSISIIGQSLFALNLRVLMITDKMKSALWICLFAAFCNMLVDYYLTAKIGLAGIGWGAAIGTTLSSILNLYVLNKSLKLGLSKKAVDIFKIMIASIPVVAVAMMFNKLWFVFSPKGLSLQLIYGVTTAFACCIVYLFTLHRLGFINKKSY